MQLSKLLEEVKTISITGPTDIDIIDIQINSRLVGKGSMFVARVGVDVDAHRFIPQAIEAGARAIVCQQLPQTLDPNVTYILVENADIALGYIASAYYDHPSQKLTLVGVTGTNGKTTIATLLYEMARMMGLKAGLLSTVAIYVDEQRTESEHTTPDTLSTYSWLHKMVEAGCRFASMEVSSHACAQHRIAGLDFDGAIFTNITRDHLDYHKTYANYINAKKMFFDSLKPQAWALVNADDKNGQVMLQNCQGHKYTYSIQRPADFHVRLIEDHIQGMLLSFNGVEIQTQFAGRFNASNLAAVYGASVLLGWSKDKINVDMSLLRPVAGRFQTFHSREGVTAVVDYAHTPDALINVLDTISEVITAPERHKIITVVGCGGNRDKGKRPQMAQAAAQRSNILVITSDNPRNERPEDIANDMLAGLDEGLLAKTIVELDRRKAIEKAVELSSEGDIILIAGKGHETQQIIGDVANHFDDREVVKEIFRL